MSDGGDRVGNDRRGGRMVKYRERIYILEKAATSSDMTVLRGGVDGGINDGSPQTPAWHRYRYQLGTATGQSDGSPPPDV